MSIKTRKRCVYIVIFTNSIGGAEKRFFEIWRANNNVILIISKELFDSYQGIYGSISYKNILLLKSKSRFKQYLEVVWYSIRAGQNAVFHYPMKSVVLIHKILRQKVIVSHVVNTLLGLNSFIGKIKLFYSFMLCDRIDVLSFKNYLILKSLFIFNKKLSVTIGSFVDETVYYPDYQNKENLAVIMGRFADNDIKNIELFSSMLSCLYNLLSSINIEYRFHIIGYGPRETNIRKNIFNLPDNYVTVSYEKNPEYTLRKAKIIFSLQKNSNYPSKALLEGIFCGCIPVITNSGDSKLIGGEPFARYINPCFSVNDIFNTICEIEKLTPEEFKNQSDLLIQNIKGKHSIERSIKYYRSLWYD